MAERNIKILVRDKKALDATGQVIVCGNSDYTITFDFDDDWSPAGVRTARFVYVRDGQVHHQDVVFEGTTVSVPVLSGITSVKVGVFEGDLSTTTPASIRCKESILCGSGAPEDPTPDVYDQIMALFDSLADQGAFGATEEQARQIEANRAGIEALVNGTTPAGNATRLGDKAASEYVLVKGEYLSTSILEYALTLGEGEFFVRFKGSSYAGNDLPYNNYSYGSAKIYKRGSGAIAVTLYGSYSTDSRSIATNYFNGSQWSGWIMEATTADLANYLPLSGGTVKGDVSLIKDSASLLYLLLRNSLRQVNMEVQAGGTFRLRDTTNGKDILTSTVDGTTTLNGTASGNLPLSGGTVGGGGGMNPLSIKGGATTSLLRYYNSASELQGYLGFINNKPVFQSNTNAASELLHTGNSAATKVQASAPSDTTAVWVW